MILMRKHAQFGRIWSRRGCSLLLASLVAPSIAAEPGTMESGPLEPAGTTQAIVFEDLFPYVGLRFAQRPDRDPVAAATPESNDVESSHNPFSFDSIPPNSEPQRVPLHVVERPVDEGLHAEPSDRSAMNEPFFARIDDVPTAAAPQPSLSTNMHQNSTPIPWDQAAVSDTANNDDGLTDRITDYDHIPSILGVVDAERSMTTGGEDDTYVSQAPGRLGSNDRPRSEFRITVRGVC